MECEGSVDAYNTLNDVWVLVLSVVSPKDILKYSLTFGSPNVQLWGYVPTLPQHGNHRGTCMGGNGKEQVVFASLSPSVCKSCENHFGSRKWCEVSQCS